MKKFWMFAATSVLALSTIAAHADLLGSSVTGSLTLAPANNGSFGNSIATISAADEFTGTSTAYSFLANFTANGLVIADTCTSRVAVCSASLSTYTMVFQDTAFAGLNLITLTNGLGATFSLVGDTLTVTGSLGTTGTTSSIVALLPAQTPEPTSLVLLGTGLLGTLGAARRRFKA